MEHCDEAAAKFMGEALLNHAKDICRYARTYSERVYPTENEEKLLKKKFVRNVERMLKEMHALMLMAKYKGISRFCNREQIEAYIEDAYRFIEAPASSFVQSAPQYN